MPQDQTFFPSTWMWLFEIAIGILVVLAVSVILKKLTGVLRRKSAQKIDKIVHLPLQIAVWGFGLAYVVDVVVTHFGLDSIANVVHPLRIAFVVACFGWIVLRWVKYTFKHLAKKSEKLGVSPSTIYALSKLSAVVVSILTLLVIFQIFGMNVGPLLAFGGIGMAGITLAAKDMISNFFGGTMLHISRIFTIGDEVVIPAQNNFEGEVREIGWYTTMIEDYSRRPVYFPNALFSNTHVINESRRSHRRIKATVAIRFEDAACLEKILEELKEKIGAHPDIDNSQSFSIALNNLSDNGIEIYAYLLVYKMGFVKFLGVKQNVFLIIQEVVSKHGAEFVAGYRNFAPPADA